MKSNSKNGIYGIAGLDDGKLNRPEEIDKFLEGISDKERLVNILRQMLQTLETSISRKQDTISDLNTIRSNAEAGKQSSELVGDSVLIGIRAENNGKLIARYRTIKQDKEQ